MYLLLTDIYLWITDMFDDYREYITVIKSKNDND